MLQKLQEMKALDEASAKLTKEMKALDQESAKLTRDMSGLLRGNTIDREPDENPKRNKLPRYACSADIPQLRHATACAMNSFAEPQRSVSGTSSFFFFFLFLFTGDISTDIRAAHNVLLGIASARDVGSLPPAQLAILDAGLTAMALRLIPLKSGSVGGASAAEWRNLLNLFSSASLPVVYPVATPSGSIGITAPRTEFRNFRDHRRNRTQRLNDGVVAWRSEGSENDTRGRLVYETLYQLIQFRGIHLA